MMIYIPPAGVKPGALKPAHSADRTLRVLCLIKFISQIT